MFSRLWLIYLLVTVLAACESSPISAGAGPSVWIDYPADGMSFPLEPIIVNSHSSGALAINQVELYVNGLLARTDLNPDSSIKLVAMSQPWTPTEPGLYALEIRAQDTDGNYGRSLPIHITIGSSGTTSTPTTEAPTLIISPIVTLTSEPLVPTATFTKNANCREGPGTIYEAVDALLQGQSFPIEGRNPDSSWWWIKRPSGRHCWVSGSTVSVSGDLSNVTVVFTPAPPQQPPQQTSPTAPNDLKVEGRVCQGSTYSVALSWQDTTDNELGYRVYRNTILIASLGANTANYTDNPPPGGPYTYFVEAFNDAGASGAATSDPGCIF